METIFESKRTSLLDHLESIQELTADPTEACIQSYNASVNHFLDVVHHIRSHPFHEKQQEIAFLKCFCPFFIGEIIFQKLLCSHIQQLADIVDPKPLKSYYKQQKRTIQRWQDRHHDLISYHSSGLTNRDNELVLSPLSTFQFPIDDSCIILNRDFISDYSIVIGRNIAYQRFRQRLISDYNALKIVPFYPEVYPTRENIPVMTWTESKAAAVELINALIFYRCINNGDCTIKQVISHFETCFNIKVGNYYDIFNEIKARKNPTQFLDKIKTALDKKVKEEC